MKLNNIYEFTNNLFDINKKNWKNLLSSFVGQPTHVLEIGVYEGAATTWLLDNILQHPASSITCIDPFEGGMEHKSDSTFEKEIQNIESRFVANIKATQKENRVIPIKSNSFTGLLGLINQKKLFDVIHIDGSHVACDVLTDAILSWDLFNEYK